MHRDLKPQNILLDSDMNIKFVRPHVKFTIVQIDFGDAKKEGEEPFEEEIKVPHDSQLAGMTADMFASF